MFKRNIIITLILFYVNSYSQDIAFTQSFMVPETINPSFSGFNGSTKFGLLYKNQQWNGFDFNVNSEYMFFDDWYSDLNSGIGISFISHQETFTKYSLNQLNINWTYEVQINYDWSFRPSVSFGFATKDFGFDNIIFEDQINIYQNIISLSTYDPIALEENTRYLDFGASFLVYTDQHWLGLTLRHLNKPNISMVSQGNLPLDLFISAHASLELPFLRYNDNNRVNLIMNFVQQAKYDRFDFGLQYMYDRFSFALTAATNPIQTTNESHFVTSINPVVGFVWEGFKFGYSYDFNISNIGGDGGISELSITYDFLNNKDCFGCPTYNK